MGTVCISTRQREIAGIPSSWPGYDLTIGASGQKVRQLQEQLDAIATVYTAIPRVAADGIYGPATAAAVQGVPVHLRPAPDRRHGFCDVV